MIQKLFILALTIITFASCSTPKNTPYPDPVIGANKSTTNDCMLTSSAFQVVPRQ